jgi:hypothetical protein
MGGGASSGGGGWTPVERLMEDRHVHRNLLLECHARGIRADVVEAYGMRRTTVADTVDCGLDLYADTRGPDRHSVLLSP